MTLAAFLSLYSHVPIYSRRPTVEPINPAIVFVDATDRFTPEMKWELWHLSDYVVSSSSCGVATLLPRKPA